MLNIIWTVWLNTKTSRQRVSMYEIPIYWERLKGQKSFWKFPQYLKATNYRHAQKKTNDKNIDKEKRAATTELTDGNCRCLLKTWNGLHFPASDWEQWLVLIQIFPRTSILLSIISCSCDIFYLKDYMPVNFQVHYFFFV